MPNRALLLGAPNAVSEALESWLNMAIPDWEIHRLSPTDDSGEWGQLDAHTLIVVCADGLHQPLLELIEQVDAARSDTPIVVVTTVGYAAHRRLLERAGATACVAPWEVNGHLLPFLRQLDRNA